MWIADKKFILVVLISVLVTQFTWLSSVWLLVNHGWIDIPLHFFGGVLVVSLALFLSERYHFSFKGAFLALVYLLALTALIGLLWEGYEYASNYLFSMYLNTSVMELPLKDTLGDLAFDLLGGLTAALIYLKSLKDLQRRDPRF